MNYSDRKCTFGHVRLAKIQISLRIRAVWSEFSLDALRIAKDNFFMRTTKTEQIARMRRLILVFVWRPCQMVSFLTVRLSPILIN